MSEMPSLRRTVLSLRRLVGDGPTDATLLARFAGARDEAAFAELVRRHGPMVLGVARRILGDVQAAEDVFQAAFFVLARKAHTIVWQASVAPWLHTTAARLARKARATARRRPAPQALDLNELPASPADTAAPLLWQEVRQALDEELERLPERLRAPLVLCYLQGRTRDEASRALNCSLATLKRRLERGRNLLGHRLARRGLALGAAGWGLVLHESSVSAATAAATARAATAFVAHGQVAPTVAALLQGTSCLTSLRCTLAALVLLTCGAGILALPRANEQPETPAAKAPSPAAPQADADADPLPAGAVARLGSIRWRPGARTTHLAFSPDGKRLASLGYFLYFHDRLSIWDTATGRELKTWLIEEHLAVALSWRADGRGFVVLKQQDLPTARIKDFRLREFTDEHAAPPPPPKTARGFAVDQAVGQKRPEQFGYCTLSPDGKRLAAHRSGGPKPEPTLELWQVKAAGSVKDLKHVRSLRDVPQDCTSLAFTPDARTLLLFHRKKESPKEELLTVWDLAKDSARRTFTIPRSLHQGERGSYALSPDGRTLALGLENGTTHLFDLTEGRERLTVDKPATQGKQRSYPDVSSVAFSRDGKNLIVGHRDNSIRIHDAANGRQLFDLRGHHSWPEAIALSPNGKLLATSGQDSLIRLWDVASGKAVSPPQGHTSTVWGVAVAGDGRTVATTGWDGTLRLWDLSTGRQKHVIHGPHEGPCFTPDGRAVLAAHKNQLRMWATTTGAELTLPDELAKEGGYPFGFSADGRTLLTGRDREASLWDWPSGRPRQKFTAQLNIASAALSADGRTLLTAGGQGSAYATELWDTVSGRVREKLPLQSGFYKTLGAITPDSGLALLVVRNQLIHAWNLRPPSHNRTFTSSHENGAGRYILSIALSPDGRTLATAENDGSAALFEVATGQVRRRLFGHREGVTSLAFTPDGRRLVTGSCDHSCLVWDVSLAAAARKRESKLSAEETAKLWTDLAAEKTAVAYPAMCRLAAAPEAAVTLLKANLRPAEGPDEATLDRLVKQLDSAEFEVREKASAELDRFGETAVAGIRQRLAASPTLEVRRRLELILEKQDSSKTTPQRLRRWRALELLEHLGSDEAKTLLRKLAEGNASAPQTQEARAALARLRH